MDGTDNDGGRGGDAGSAGDVVAHGGTTGLRTITTLGDSAPAFLAKSIAGSGANGGSGKNFGDGGAGGFGGTAGDVSISGQWDISTSGDNSAGIAALSLGGPGGQGGDGGWCCDTSGGGGGASGPSGDVTVTLESGSKGINTNGTGSHAILAQSIGGHAGSARTSDSLVVSFAASAGSAGAAGDVTVTNSDGAPITTEGNEAVAIFAQSIGGGGGNGGDSSSIPGFADFYAQGGSGSIGAIGGSVSVENAGSITIAGNSGGGIVAQSVGGTGGSGGTSSAKIVSLGGGASDGANGGSVTIDNSGDISDTINTGDAGEDAICQVGCSPGIVAQSIGGGGGFGGSSFSEFSLGGRAGGGGDGGEVSVTNSGAINPANAKESPGIHAQSVCGGGGRGGAALALAPGASIAIGAQGGVGGHGESVTIENNTEKVTGGNSDNSHGLWAQSIGGGGGYGGTSASISGDFELPAVALAVGANGGGGGDGGGRGGTGAIGQGGSVSVGGGGAATGDGGDVTVTVGSSAAIMAGANTADSDITVASYGIFAQSVGGGGGHAGNVSVATNDYSLYGTGLAMSQNTTMAGGDGGTVTVNSNGLLQTDGKSSIGIFAQSVGGGGGIAGEVTQNSTGAMIGSNGGEGTAGPVSVTISNSVETDGETAHGVVAQSVGGLSGSGSATTTDTKVSVTLTGENAIIQTAGAGSSGIYAQSSGHGKGPIAVTIEEGARILHGGPLGNTGIVGAGIVIQEGTNNTIVNKGTIQLFNNADPSAGVAIRAIDVPGVSEPSQVVITNSGTIDGWICVDNAGQEQCAEATQPAAPLDAAAASSAAPTQTQITLINEEGGVLNSGDVYEVARFENRGTLQPGGPGRVSTLRHDGDFIHTESGRMVMTLDAANNTSDRMQISGTADLRGDLIMELIDLGGEKPRESVTILVAEDGLSQRSGSLFSIQPSVVAGYELAFVGQNRVDVSYDIDFASPQILAVTTHNEGEVARHIQSVFADGALEPVFEDLVEIQDLGSYKEVLGSLDGQIYADTQLTTLYSSQYFKDSMLSCGERSGDARFITEAQCSWMRVDGRHLNRDQTSASRGFDETAFQFAGGGQFAVAEDWFLGGALSIEYRSLDEDGGYADADGRQFQGGLVAKRQFGDTLVSGAFSGGFASFDTSRSVFSGATAEGDQNIWLLSGQLRAEHAFEFTDWYVKPRGDLGVDYVSSGGLTESGAGSLDLKVRDSDDVYVYLQPAVEVGMEHVFDSGTVARPWLSVGVTQFLTSKSPTTTASFIGDPTSSGSFTTQSELDRTYLDLEAGLTVLTVHNVNVSAVGVGRLSSNTQSYGGGLKASLLF